MFSVQGAFAMYHEEIKDKISSFIKNDLQSYTENYPVNEEEEEIEHL